MFSFSRSKRVHRKLPYAHNCRPRLEALEDRTVPSTLAVTKNGADITERGTLRYAVANAQGGDGVGTEQLPQAYGQLPLSFEANQGQTAAQVNFLARGPGYALFLTAGEAVLSLQKPAAANPGPGAAAPAPQGDVLRMQLVGASATPRLVGLDQLPGTTNYFIGNNPSRWHTNIPNYARVAYQGLYPGVDLVYYGDQRQLEYDFDVAPGADPAAIRFAVQGAKSLSLDAQGNLVLSTAIGNVVEDAPVIYQTVGSIKEPVAGDFVLLGNDQVGFRVGSYNRSLPLTIDPVLNYSTYLGGNGADFGQGIAVDSSGNAYVTGFTGSTNFPITPGAVDTMTSTQGYDVFVTKLNAAGTALVYSAEFGGNSNDYASGIALDGAGNAYVVGTTNSTDFPSTAGAFQTSFPGGTSNAFLTELNPTGTALIYSTYLGGSNGQSAGFGIAVDSSGNAYVTGGTFATDFPTTDGSLQTSLGGDQNAFVTELNATGTALIYSTYLGGNGGANGNGIALDSSGNAYVTGSAGSNFPTTPGAFQTCEPGGVFVTELNPTGTALIYSTYLGGSNGQSAGFGIAVDDSGNAYVTGFTTSTDFPTTDGSFQTSLGGDQNAFVTELNPTGTALIYSTYLGGSGQDFGHSIAVDSGNNAYVTGWTSSTNFPTTPGAFQTSYGGGANDVFVTKLNATGTALSYSTYLGGSGDDVGQGIAVDGAGDAYVVGTTNSTNFPTTAGAFQTSHSNDNGNRDAFVTKLALTFNPTISTTAQPSSTTVGNTVADAATISGGYDPTGTVTFNLYDNPDATGTSLFTDTEPLFGDTASSASYSTTAVGTEYWVGTYNGDSNNNPVSSGAARGFARAFGSNTDSATYVAAFDYMGAGFVTNADSRQFALRFGLS
jgi:hypothetical protein